MDFSKYYYLLEARERTFLDEMVKHLDKQKKVLLLTTSNRSEKSDDIPKSTKIARYVEQQLAGKAVLIDVTRLKLYECEGNVSNSLEPNQCGLKESVLKDKERNPSGCHRCWASYKHKDDELWKISKQLFESDSVIFFGSVRWGQTNAVYQRLIERLTWLENRHTTLKESNIIKDIEAGVVFVGQNWNGEQVIETQKQVLKFFGFKVPNVLSWNWQYTKDKTDETLKSYKEAPVEFKKQFFNK